MQIRAGIVGYGNLGRGVERALLSVSDMTLSGIFTRRDPAEISAFSGAPVYPAERAKELCDGFDVLILCGGSADDLPEQTARFARNFNVVDSFDTHSKIQEHFAAADAAGRAGGKIGIISAGWDPGLFSVSRLLGEAVLPGGADYTFWGRGVSQGHSEAVRRLAGVRDARQYTVPLEESLLRVRAGEAPALSPHEMHRRECFVVPEENADRQRIEADIKNMPDYFAGYETTVHFVTQEQFDHDHSAMPHGGTVLRTGATGENGCHRQLMEYRLRLDSNPEFTAGVLVAYARAAWRLNREGQCGCRTVFDVAPAYLHPASGEELRKKLL